MKFFQQIFDGLTSLSSKLPKFDIGAAHIILLVSIAVFGLAVAITFVSSSANKMRRAANKILRYLIEVENIDDDNVQSFTATCFGNNAPISLKNAWVSYMGVRFGYPSEVITDSKVFDREVRRNTNIRANVFIAVALIFVGFFAFGALGSNPSVQMGMVVSSGLVLCGGIYLLLTILNVKLYNKSRDAFYNMQDELDAKVDFHVERSFAMDESPLMEMTALIDEIIARNTAKVVDMPKSDEPDDVEEEPVEDSVDGDELNADDQLDETEREFADPKETPIEMLITEIEANETDVSGQHEDSEDQAYDNVGEVDAIVEDQAEQSEQLEQSEQPEEFEQTESILIADDVVDEEVAPESVTENAEDGVDGDEYQIAEIENEVEENIDVEQSLTDERIVDEQMLADEEDTEITIVETADAEDDVAMDEDVEDSDAEVDVTVDEDVDGDVENIDDLQEATLEIAMDTIVEETADEDSVDEEITSDDTLEQTEEPTDDQPQEAKKYHSIKLGSLQEDYDESVSEFMAYDFESKEEDVAADLTNDEKIPADAEEIIEDENIMFGKKKKEEKHLQEQKIFVESELIDDDGLEELAFDELPPIVEVEQTVEEPTADQTVVAEAQESVEPTTDADEPIIELMEDVALEEDTQIVEEPETLVEDEQAETVDEISDEALEELQDAVEAEDFEENVEYEELIENLDDGDDDVKAPKLANLPNLVDYMLGQVSSRRNKLLLAQALFRAYAKFKNSPENQKIVKKCLTNVMASLIADMKK